VICFTIALLLHCYLNTNYYTRVILYYPDYTVSTTNLTWNPKYLQRQSIAEPSLPLKEATKVLASTAFSRYFYCFQRTKAELRRMIGELVKTHKVLCSFVAEKCKALVLLKSNRIGIDEVENRLKDAKYALHNATVSKERSHLLLEMHLQCQINPINILPRPYFGHLPHWLNSWRPSDRLGSNFKNKMDEDIFSCKKCELTCFCE